MTISKTMNGNCLELAVEGRLDTVTAPDLDAELSAVYDSIDSLIFDMQKLDYISSAGLRVLLKAQKTMKNKGGMILRNLNSDVREVLDITGFSEIMTIE